MFNIGDQVLLKLPSDACDDRREVEYIYRDGVYGLQLYRIGDPLGRRIFGETDPVRILAHGAEILRVSKPRPFKLEGII